MTHLPKMTKEAFVDAYVERSKPSGVTQEDILNWFVALPCDCGHDQCEGWAMVANNAKSKAHHYEFYGPKE